MIDGHSTTGRVATAVAVASVCTVSVLPAAASTLSAPVSAIAGAADEGDFAGLVDIGDGRRLYLECRGSGSPTVVFSSGFGNGADIWGEAGAEAWRASNPGASGIAVLPAVAQFDAGVCL